jgi:hypothetical protein
MEEAHKQVTTGQPLSPAFPARWLTTYSVLTPVRPGFVVTVTRENIFHALGTCIGAPGPHGFVVRRSAPLAGIAISVHRTPFHVRDDAYVPLAGAGWATQ